MKKSALVVVENNTPITTSLIVAEQFDKNHRHVLEAIRDIIKQTEDAPMFNETTWTNEQNGQTYPMYTMTRDGFSLLAMGFTGAKAFKFKLIILNAIRRQVFNA